MYNALLKKILGLKGFTNLINSNYCKSSFSQFGEDLLINKLLNKISNGNFLDLGSFHPMHFSNTFLLYLKGWRGISIDANREMVDISKKLRPLDKNIFAYLSNKEKECFYIINKKNPPMNRVVDSIQKLDENEIFEKINTITLDTVIQNHQRYLEKLYYLNIDLEFLDELILKSFNFKKYHPLVITIEIHNFNFNTNNSITNFLKKHNYTLHSYLFPTAFYVDKEFKKNDFNLLKY